MRRGAWQWLPAAPAPPFLHFTLSIDQAPATAVSTKPGGRPHNLLLPALYFGHGIKPLNSIRIISKQDEKDINLESFTNSIKALQIILIANKIKNSFDEETG